MPTIPKTLSRYANLAVESRGDTLTFSFSSEYPVDRGWGVEILDHSPKAADLDRIQSGNLLFNHDQSIILGSIERAWIEQSLRKGYCEVRWSQRTVAQEYRRDVEDGIIKNVSFRYNVVDARPIPGELGYRVMKWEPLEVSLVSVPADPTVGINRSLFEANFLGIDERNEKEMQATTEDIRSEAIQSERERIAAIQALSGRHGYPDLAMRAISDGYPIERVREMFLEKIAENPQAPVARPVNPLGLSEKEQRQYSLLRAINASITNDWSKAGFERECSQEVAKRTGKETAGFFVPVRDIKFPKSNIRATYATGAADTGGRLVETTLMSESFIDALRDRLVIRSLGAQMMSGLQGNVDIPGQDGVTATYWVPEGIGGSADLTQAEATFRLVSLRPKTVGALSMVTRTQLLQSSIDMEAFIRNDFAAVMARAVDRAAIRGSGTNNEPRGILNLAGVNSVAIGTNGGAPTYATIIQMMSELEVDNADVGSLSWLTNPRVKAKLMLTSRQASGVEGNFVLTDPNNLIGYNFAMTNQVPSNLTKGTGTALSALIFGNFSDLLIGEWGVLEMLPNPYGAGYRSGGIEMRVLQTIDIAFRYAVSFCVCTDINTTL